MSVRIEELGKTSDGELINAYHLENGKGMEVVVLNLGGIIRNIIVPDREGKGTDIALGYDGFEGYFTDKCFLGAAVGPSANRVAKGRYIIDGKEYKLPVNENGNNLHTDFSKGFHKRVWEAEATGDNEVTLSLECPDGEMGFPGNRRFAIRYTVTADNALILHYHGESDERTLINITNHSYFNLGGHNAGYIGEHRARFAASDYTPVDEGSIPTGEIAPVKDTALDFTTEKAIGRDIESSEEQMRLVSGYDHNFVIDGADGTMREFATVVCDTTGIKMVCSTTQPGFQFYSGNFLTAQNVKGGGSYVRRDGFCLETQVYPDSINKQDFPDAVYGPDRVYDTETVYRFEKI